MPQGVSSRDTRGVIRQSLKTSDATEASIKARQIGDALEAYWAALLLGKDPTQSWNRYEAAVQIASLRGFTYRSTAERAEGPLADLMPRIADIEKDLDQESVVEAVIGGAPELEIKLSTL